MKLNSIYNGLIWLGLTAILVFTPLARGAVRVWSITPVLLVVTVLVFAWLRRVNNAKLKNKLTSFYKSNIINECLIH
ncbi:MAG: hypothetical protein HQ547_07435 [Candidatus Omnitrophica bacterium]|nr:hypothetical protein [Candidatus Omnitrophota bacterium]